MAKGVVSIVVHSKFQVGEVRQVFRKQRNGIGVDANAERLEIPEWLWVALDSAL
jgi:hypothetical protein